MDFALNQHPQDSSYKISNWIFLKLSSWLCHPPHFKPVPFRILHPSNLNPNISVAQAKNLRITLNSSLSLILNNWLLQESATSYCYHCYHPVVSWNIPYIDQGSKPLPVQPLSTLVSSKPQWCSGCPHFISFQLNTKSL